MERLTICRICLNANVSLLIPDTPLQELYEKLTSVPFQSTLKPSLLCYVCHTQLYKASMLMQQCLRAEELLKRRLNQLLTSEDTVQQKSIDKDKTEAPPLTCASVQQMQIESLCKVKEKTSVAYDEDFIDVITEIKSEDNRKIVKTEVTPLICAAVQRIHNDELPHVEQKNSVTYEEDTIDVKTEVENDEGHKIDEKGDTPLICTAVQQIHINTLPNAKERTHATYEEHVIDIKIKIENEESEKIDDIEVTPFIHTAIHQIHIDSLTNTKERTHVTCERDVIDVRTEVKSKEDRAEPDVDLHLASDHSDIDDEQISSDPEDDIPLNSIKERVDGVVDEQNVTRAVSTEPIGWDTGNPVVKKTGPSKDNSIIADVGSYVCKICDKRFTQIGRLQTHERVHTGEKPYACKICDKRFTQTGNLHRHERVHAGDRPYSCKICDKRFNRMCSLRKHEIIHTAGRLYSCKTCDKGFADISNLKRHERLHTGERLHVCKLCDKRFTQIGYLETHERGHTGDRAYSCKICDKRFTQIRSLRTHERLHTGVGLHICKVCDKRFTGLWSLQRHSRVHSGERPYICKICYKSFSLKGQLKTHDLTHTGDKPHSCKICDKRFAVKGNLQRHERIHTSKKPSL